jgi:hypothetical protein
MVEDGMRIGFVHLFAKGHGAQANGRNLQIAGAQLNKRKSHAKHSNHQGL